MRFIKLGLISMVFFCLLLTGISLLLPPVTNISRTISINAPADSVYRYINNLAEWKHWYADYSTSKTSLTTADNGKKMLTVNRTAVTIIRSLPGKITAMWQTGKSDPLAGEFNFITNDTASAVTVQWHFTQQVKWYPWQKFASIASNKIIGPFMEKSLENLKREAEK